ncbi:hypothetical protein C8R43DRAFT_1235720 [Mycena crocata]|nr:hypothetical protein C8R43DRAFT_1235720 [Mycena crocata]
MGLRKTQITIILLAVEHQSKRRTYACVDSYSRLYVYPCSVNVSITGQQRSLLWLGTERRLFDLGSAKLCLNGERFRWKDGLLGSIQAQVEAISIRGAVVIDP